MAIMDHRFSEDEKHFTVEENVCLIYVAYSWSFLILFTASMSMLKSFPSPSVTGENLLYYKYSSDVTSCLETYRQLWLQN